MDVRAVGLGDEVNGTGRKLANDVEEGAKEIVGEAKEVTLAAAEIIALALGVVFIGMATGGLLLIVAII